MRGLAKDLQYSLRMLTKSPLFTGVALLTLVLGIGLNATTFSAVNGLLLRPLGGVEQPERLVQLYRQWPGIEYGSNSIPHYQDLRDRSGEVFSDVAAWFFTPVAMSSEGRNERLFGMVVSANFFQTYGVQPLYGRAFLPGVEDRDPGAHPVVMLGHAFWQERFGGDRQMVGSTVELNGLAYEVVGIAPREFTGPMVGADPPLYLPLMMQPMLMPGDNRIDSRGNNNMTVVARLQDGVGLQRAESALDAILLGLREEHPRSYEDQVGTTLVPQLDAGMHPSMRGAQAAMATLMLSVVGLLLLVACVNVANLFLARARERRQEMAVRMSLGAGRWRVVRQLLVESLVFSVIAGAASLALALVATRLLSRIRPPMDGPFAFDFGLDSRVLLFTAAISLGTGLLFGLAPAMQSSRARLVATSRGSSVQRSRASRLLVVGQMALSLVLLISAGLFLRSMQGAMGIDPGFRDPGHLAMASVDPGLQGYDEAQARAFYDRLQDELLARPEIDAVGFVETLPLGFGNSDRGVEIPGYEFAEGERNSLHYTQISPGYLEAMGTSVLEGRTFTRADDAGAEPVIVINRAFAERFWPGESALGRIVGTAGADRRIVGVVETGKYRSLGEDPTEFMYLPQRQVFSSGMTAVARTSGPPALALATLRSTVAGIDSELALFDLRTMEDHMGIALMPARVGGIVLGFFGTLGLLLAAVGIYGVMDYSVVQRRREMRVRVALGADRPTVTRLVLSEGLRLAVFGAVVGLLGAAGAARLVEGMLYQTRALDPLTFAAVPAILLVVAAAAVYLPARRAANTDPVRALAAE